MLYAQIKNGMVQNIIVIEDTNLLPLFSQGFDSLIDVTNLSSDVCPYGTHPGPGDLYDGSVFSRPPQE